MTCRTAMAFGFLALTVSSAAQVGAAEGISQLEARGIIIVNSKVGFDLQEQVVIDNPQEGVWRIVVQAMGLASSQPFGIAISAPPSNP